MTYFLVFVMDLCTKIASSSFRRREGKRIYGKRVRKVDALLAAFKNLKNDGKRTGSLLQS